MTLSSTGRVINGCGAERCAAESTLKNNVAAKTTKEKRRRDFDTETPLGTRSGELINADPWNLRIRSCGGEDPATLDEEFCALGLLAVKQIPAGYPYIV